MTVSPSAMPEPTINSVTAQQQAIAAASQEAQRLTVKTAQLRMVVDLRAQAEHEIALNKVARAVLKDHSADLKALLAMSDELADDPDLCPCELEGMIVDFRKVLSGESLISVASERVGSFDFSSPRATGEPINFENAPGETTAPGPA